MKRIVSYILALILILSGGASAHALGVTTMNQSRAVIGANLTEEQISLVYQAFGVQRGSVIELKMTNAEERSYLQGYVSDAVIGTRSISSVYVELRASGTGMDVTTSNITWCSPQMYLNALTTAGVSDAHIVVAAPFEVSGTAALAGVYKAYEDMTGRKLDATAKSVGTQELTVTGELAAAIGSYDSTAIVNELKLILAETARMSDEELRVRIIEIAAGYHVSLTEKQIGQLITLCRSLQKLDVDSLRSRVQQMQGMLERLPEIKDQAVGFWQQLRNAVMTVRDFFNGIASFFNW